MSKTLEITKAEFDANKEDYLDRVENGEIILVRHPNGSAVLAIPERWDDELMHLWNHDDGA
tara:strand:+ start:710 stop:892 length:183 start_codon:yes stop_codon:yes gene_type:complete